MPIIRKEINSPSTETEQKLNFNKAKLQINKYHNIVTTKKETVDLLRTEVTTNAALQKLGQNKSVQISKLAESMAKITETTLQKMEQNKSVQISKLAESMAKMTEATLHKIEQNECAKISKLIEQMHKMPETTDNEFNLLSNDSNTGDLKRIKLIRKLHQPWFQ